MTTSTIFHLIRHGAHDLLGRMVAGRTPRISLNALGRAQAEAVAAALVDHRLRAFIATPLQRTQEMAAPLAARLGQTIRIEDELTDLDFGAWTMVPFAELHRDPRWAAFNRFRSATAIPGGETMSAVQARALRCVLRLRDQFPAGEIAIFSHGDVIRSVLMHFLGMPLDFFHRIEISPGSRSVLVFDGEGVQVSALNLPARP
jgi:broad specificity phosphatase PhoE